MKLSLIAKLLLFRVAESNDGVRILTDSSKIAVHAPKQSRRTGATSCGLKFAMHRIATFSSYNGRTDTSAVRHFGSKTLRQQSNTAEVSGYFGSTADVSYGLFGSAAEVSRGVRVYPPGFGKGGFI